jgi:predicted enzyme related to lactoylglutathione lyase
MRTPGPAVSFKVFSENTGRSKEHLVAAGVASVWVPVDDMERAVTFYGTTLGLKITKQDEKWSEIDANGLMIGLNAYEETAERTAGGAVITFEPEGGLDGEYERLSAAGVEFAGGVSEFPWGRFAAFHDSEGNDLQLYAPPKES